MQACCACRPVFGADGLMMYDLLLATLTPLFTAAGPGKLRLQFWQGTYHDVADGWRYAARNNGGAAATAAHAASTQQAAQPQSSTSSGSGCAPPGPPVNPGRPALVYAPNAGITVQPSWGPTLRRLAAPGGPPVLLTDFCQEAAVQSQLLLEQLIGVKVRGRREGWATGYSGWVA